mgnify:CR=1 FL=1
MTLFLSGIQRVPELDRPFLCQNGSINYLRFKMPERSDHIPVLLDEVISALKPEAGGFYLDGTFGAGGYSQALLKAADCKVLGIDCDMTVSSYAQDLLAIYPKKFQFLTLLLLQKIY